MTSESSRLTPKKLLVLELAVAAILILSTVAVVLTFDFNDDETEPFGTLKIGLMEQVDSLNPCVGFTHSSMIFYGLVYDCLQAVGDDMEMEPNLALDWSVVHGIEPYGSVWEYTLTQNAVWHDGVPFDASDVVFTLNMMAGNYSETWAHRPYTYFIHHAELVDNSTVRVHFFDRSTGDPMPVTFGDSLLIPILPRHLLHNYTATTIGFNWLGAQASSDPPLIGTGPFMATSEILDEWQEGDKITVVRNPNYHRTADRGDEVKIEGIELHFFDDDIALAIALEVAYVDVASMSPQSYSYLREKIDSGMISNVWTYNGLTCTNQLLAMTFGNYRCADSPMIDDIVIRRALAMSINRSEAIEEAYLGLGEEGSTLISPMNQRMHCEMTDEEMIGYDPLAAAELLEENGYRFTDESPDVRVATNDSASVKNGWVPENTPLELTIGVMYGDTHLKPVADLAVSVWEDLGAKISVVYQTVSYWPTPTITPLEYDIRLTDRVISHPDPSHLLFSYSTCVSDGWMSYSYTNYSNETYDENYIRSVTEIIDAEREQSVKACQRTYYLDVGAIILAYPHQNYAWRTDTFNGWGDWAVDPGRSIDAFWGGNPLYFDIASGPSSTDSTSLSSCEPLISRTRP